MKLWTITTDCGGLKHVFDDTFRFLKAQKMIAYISAANKTHQERVQLMKW